MKHCERCNCVIESKKARFCPPCANRRAVERAVAFNKAKSEALRGPRPRGPKIRVRRFEHQRFSRGQYVIPIISMGEHSRIDLVCGDCKRDNLAVRGDWSPIFDDNERGHVLLCRACYEVECQAAG